MKTKLGFFRTKTAIAVGIIAFSIVAAWGLTPSKANAQRATKAPSPSHATGPMTINSGEGLRIGMSHKPGGGATGQSRRRGGVIVEDMMGNIIFDIPVEPHFDAFFDINHRTTASGEGFLVLTDQNGRQQGRATSTSGVIQITAYPEINSKGKPVPLMIFNYQGLDEENKSKGTVEATRKVEEGTA